MGDKEWYDRGEHIKNKGKQGSLIKMNIEVKKEHTRTSLYFTKIWNI